MASVLKYLGHTVCFFVDSLDDTLVKRVLADGYDVACCTNTSKRKNHRLWDAVLIDSYTLTENDLMFWCGVGKSSLMFDDYNLGCKLCTKRVVSNPSPLNQKKGQQVFSGVDYIPISPIFREIARPRSGAVSEILFMFGLHDSAGATVAALEVWLELSKKIPNVRATCLLGSGSPHIGAVRRLAAEFSGKVQLLIDETEMAFFIAKADLAVGAAGLGLFERSASGLVNIAVPISKNQVAMSQWMASQGGCIMLEFYSQTFQQDLYKTISTLVKKQTLRELMSRKAMKLVDGFGAERVTTALLS